MFNRALECLQIEEDNKKETVRVYDIKIQNQKNLSIELEEVVIVKKEEIRIKEDELSNASKKLEELEKGSEKT